MLVATTIACVWLGYRVHLAGVQRAARAMVEQLGGRLTYDYEVEPGDPTFTLKNSNPPGPAWLRNTLGDEYFTSIVLVNIVEKPPADHESQQLFARLARLPSLHSLDLDCAHTEAETLKQVGNLSGLQRLTLYQVNAEAENLAPLGQLRELRELDLRGNIDGDPVAHLTQLKHLDYLRLDGDWVDGRVLASVAQCESLTRLAIECDTLSDESLTAIEGMSGLQFLSIESTGISDAALQPLQGLENLTRLVLVTSETREDGSSRPTNTISGDGFVHLRKLPKLESMELRGFEVGAQALSHLRQIPSLTNLSIPLGDLQLGPEELQELERFSQLQFLEAPMDAATETQILQHIPKLFIYNP